MKALQNLVGQTIIYGMGTMVPRLLNYLILTPYFTRLYNESNNLMEYGKVTELYAYIVFLMVILTYGMETTYFRYVNIEKDKKTVFSTIMTSIIITSTLFIILVLLFTESISEFLKYEGEQYFIQMLGGIVTIEAVSAIPFAKLRVENRAKRFAILRIIQVLLNIVIIISVYNILPLIIGNRNFLQNENGIISSKYIFLSNLIASSVILFFLLPEFRDYVFRKVRFKLYIPIIAYGLPLLISGLAGVINETLDRSIFKHVIKDTDKALYQLALYGANYKLASVILIVVQMFRYAAEPFFFNYEKEKDAKERYAQVMHIFVGVLIFIALVIILYIDIFKHFLGNMYFEAIDIVPVIALAYIFYGILFNLSAWFKLSNKTRYAVIITAVGAVITIIINLHYIREYGYRASAVAHVISYATMVIISYILSRYFYPIPYNIKRITGYFIIGGIIYYINSIVRIDAIVVRYLIKTILVAIFAIFVIKKENLIEILFKKKNESKNYK